MAFFFFGSTGHLPSNTGPEGQCLHRENGKKEYVQKRYLQWTIRELLGIVNGTIENEGIPTFPESFQRELPFRQLYDFLKKHKQYKYCNQTPHESCTCEICENIHLLTTAVNRKITNIDSKLPSSVNDIISEFTCDKADGKCMKNLCDDCPTIQIDEEDFQDPSSSSSRSSNSGSDNEKENDEISYYQWLSVDGKAAKTLKTASYDEISDILSNKIKELKLHIHVRNEQYAVYNRLKEEMPGNSMLLHVDYAESYENKQQDECQSAYFGHTTFSIFTAVVYLRRNGELIHENVVVISEANDHSRIATHSCISKVIDIVIQKHTHFKTYHSIDLNIWSDGCSSQFRSKYVFALTSMFHERFNVTRYYNERHHGKGPMDGLGGCIKNIVYRAVMAGKEIIKTPKEFAECAQRHVNNVHCEYLPIEMIMEEPARIEKAPYKTDMHILQVHMAKRHVTRADFHCMQLYRIASETESFHDQWYEREDGAESCGHFDTVDPDEVDSMCAKCVTGENGDNWIQCPRCNQWYHDGCFLSS